MKNLKTVLLIALILTGAVQFASAKAKIPFGKRDAIVVVANLPDTEKYAVAEGSKDYLDLARLHQEFNIAWFFPLWITEEPKLVLTKKGSDQYYDLTDDQINDIVKENKLNKEELLNVGFYNRYGGKIAFAVLIAFLIWGALPSKKAKVETVNV